MSADLEEYPVGAAVVLCTPLYHDCEFAGLAYGLGS